MRTTFIKTLTQLAARDQKLILVTGDLGFSVFEEFQKLYPKQYLNLGVSEQSMTGFAAGLALEGFTPIIYSINPFITMRNFEQIRNDICYQGVNVKIVSVGAGFSYGPYGHTHHGLEDIGIMRILPELTILCPGDPIEVELAVTYALKHTGPHYIRLGKSGEPNIHLTKPKFITGKGIVLKKGKEVTIITTSTMLERGFEVIKKLQEKTIHSGFISMPFIKPFDTQLIIKTAATTKAIFTLEEHSIIGGLGSAVAECLVESSSSVLFKRIGTVDRFTKVLGKQEYMRRANGLGVDQIVSFILKALKTK